MSETETKPHMSREAGEAMAERVKMALAEAGWPDADVAVNEIDESWELMSGWTVNVWCDGGPETPTHEAYYRAFKLCLPPEFSHLVPCYECYELDPFSRMGIGKACMSGDCRHGN